MESINAAFNGFLRSHGQKWPNNGFRNGAFHRDLGYCVPDQDREQALAKSAFAVMSDCGVPPTPENFELFYMYASGQNAAISRIVGDMIAMRRPFTPKVLYELRTRCLPNERAAKAMDDLGSGIGSMLDVVLEKLETAGKDASDYGRALSAATGELGDQQSPDAMRKLVDGLLGATRAMEDRSKQLESELQESSQQITELKMQLDNVRKENRIDPLTNLANRKTFDTELLIAIEELGDNRLAAYAADVRHRSFQTVQRQLGPSNG